MSVLTLALLPPATDCTFVSCNAESGELCFKTPSAVRACGQIKYGSIVQDESAQATWATFQALCRKYSRQDFYTLKKIVVYPKRTDHIYCCEHINIEVVGYDPHLGGEPRWATTKTRSPTATCTTRAAFTDIANNNTL